MNPEIITQFGTPDPNANPLNLADLVKLLNALVTSELQGSYLPYVISQTQPGVDDQDKVWVQLDAQNRPIAQKIFYRGAAGGDWRRIYNGMLGEVRGYTGDPSIDFDENGKGKVGDTYDGWQLCNGLNGSPDFSDRFLLGAHMNDADGHSGYNSGWQAYLPGFGGDFKIGGRTDYVSNATNTYRPARPDTKEVSRWEADGNAPNSSGDLYGLKSGVVVPPFLEGDPGNVTPTPWQIIPPFIALGWIIFQGYDA